MEVGSVIKYFRKKRGYTQEELADSICSITYLSKVENNKMLPSDEIRNLIGNRLGVNLSDVFHSHNHDIKNTLFNLLNAIENMDINEAKNIFYDISSREISFDNEINYNYLLYLLCKLRYLTFTIEWENSAEEDNLIDEVNEKYEMFSEELLYYFHKHMGIYYISLPQNQKSNEHLTKAKEFYSMRQDSDPELYYYLAMANAKLKRNNLSNDFAEIALNMYQSKLNVERMLDTNMLLAINYNLLGDYENAEEKLLSIINLIYTKHYNDETLARAYHNLGYIRKNKNLLIDALEYLNYSLELKKSEDALVTLHLKARVLNQLNKKENALDTIKIGKNISEENNNEKYINKFYILENRINNTIYREEFIHRLEYYVIPYFRKNGEYGDMLNNLELLAEIYYQKRLYKRASEFYKKAFLITKGESI